MCVHVCVCEIVDGGWRRDRIGWMDWMNSEMEEVSASVRRGGYGARRRVKMVCCVWAWWSVGILLMDTW